MSAPKSSNRNNMIIVSKMVIIVVLGMAAIFWLLRGVKQMQIEKEQIAATFAQKRYAVKAEGATYEHLIDNPGLAGFLTEEGKRIIFSGNYIIIEE